MIGSHPSWVRGLKPLWSLYETNLGMSHPSWVRGLKLLTDLMVDFLVRRTPRGCVD